MADYIDPAVELKTLLDHNPGWSDLLVASLKQAKEVALLKGMEAAKDWPQDVPSYLAFITKSSKLIPRQDYPRETFNVLSTFYWLLDQPTGRELQKHDSFNTWMSDFAKAWGSFLDNPESATGVETYKNDPSYMMWQYAEPKSGWNSFNEFFARAMKPGLRPVAGSRQDSIIVSSADSTFMSKNHIDDHNKITFKYTHTYSVLDLLEGSPYRERFTGGLYAHSFLGPNDYHRFHAPVRGTVLECRTITGRVFLQVTVNDEGKFEAPDDVDNGYEFFQERGLIIQDSPIGLVACLPIGMAQVSSVNMTAVKGSYLDKGDEYGFFMFGGSDMIMLFEKGSHVEWTAAPMVHTNVGMAVAEVIK